MPISQWSYELEPIGDGCRVTETWTDRRPGWFKPIAHLATGVSDRAEHTRDGMALTLERVAAAAETPAAYLAAGAPFRVIEPRESHHAQ